MTEDKEIEKNLKDLDDICDECKEQHESVTQNLILTGLKILQKVLSGYQRIMKVQNFG